MDGPQDGHSNLSKENGNNENHGTPNTRKVIASLPTNDRTENLTAFLDLHRDEDTKTASVVEMSKDLNQNNIALLHIPNGLFKGILHNKMQKR